MEPIRDRDKELEKQNEENFYKMLRLAVLEGKSITELFNDLDIKRRNNESK